MDKDIKSTSTRMKEEQKPILLRLLRLAELEPRKSGEGEDEVIREVDIPDDHPWLKPIKRRVTVRGGGEEEEPASYDRPALHVRSSHLPCCSPHSLMFSPLALYCFLLPTQKILQDAIQLAVEVHQRRKELKLDEAAGGKLHEGENPREQAKRETAETDEIARGTFRHRSVIAGGRKGASSSSAPPSATEKKTILKKVYLSQSKNVICITALVSCPQPCLLLRLCLFPFVPSPFPPSESREDSGVGR